MKLSEFKRLVASIPDPPPGDVEVARVYVQITPTMQSPLAAVRLAGFRSIALVPQTLTRPAPSRTPSSSMPPINFVSAMHEPTVPCDHKPEPVQSGEWCPHCRRSHP